MPLSVTRSFSFEAAHQLEWHAGACKNLHGHSYRLEVTVTGPVDGNGIVIDFADVNNVVQREVIDAFDHTYLNETIPVPSAENIAIWAWDRLRASSLPLHELHVHETPGCFVVYRGEGPDVAAAPRG